MAQGTQKIRKEKPRFKGLVPFLILLGMVYIAIGDRFLRPPYGQASTAMRNGILRILNISVSSTLDTLHQDPRGAARDRALEEAGQAIPRN